MMRAAPNKRLERTRHNGAFIRSCVGEPLKRNVGWLSNFSCSYNRPRRLRMKYKVVLKESEEGFSISCPGLPGCWSQGATEEEALENIQDAIAEYLAAVDTLVQGQEVREVIVAS